MLNMRHVLRPEGAVVAVGSAESGKWVGPMFDQWKADVIVMRDLLREGKVVPVIDRRYKLSELPAALEYLETGRARGKVVIVMD